MSTRAGALARLAQQALRDGHLLQYEPGETLVVDEPFPADIVRVLGFDGVSHDFEAAPFTLETDRRQKAFGYSVEPRA